MLLLGPWLLMAIIGTTNVKANSEHTPGVLLKSNITPMTPRIVKSLTPHVERRENPLGDLLKPRFLDVRQETCPSGYGQCKSYAGTCCPLGEYHRVAILRPFSDGDLQVALVALRKVSFACLRRIFVIDALISQDAAIVVISVTVRRRRIQTVFLAHHL